MTFQVILRNGKPEWAVLPYEEYLRLVEQSEMLEDIQDFDRLHEAVNNGTEELIPAAVAFSLANGGNPFKVWREFRGYTQQQVAQKVGISVPFLSQIENGKREPSVPVLKIIARILEVDEVDDLLST